MNSDQVDLSSLREEILSNIHLDVQRLDYTLVTRDQMDSYATWTSFVQVMLIGVSVFVGAAGTAFLTGWTLASEARVAMYGVAVALAAAAVLFGVITYFAHRSQSKAKRGMWPGSQGLNEGPGTEEQAEQLRELTTRIAMVTHMLEAERQHRHLLEAAITQRQALQEQAEEILGEADETDDEFGPIPEGEDIFGDQ